MASLSLDSQGRRQIQFAFNGKRHSIRLGKITQDAADAIKGHVEHLLLCAEKNKPWCPASVHWVDDLRQSADPILARLIEVGLVPRSFAQDAHNEQRDDTLGPFTAAYIARRIDLKEGTRYQIEVARDNLIAFLGSEKPLREITPDDADGFRLYLIGQKLAENTIRRRCGRAKQFFHSAVRKGLIAKNPFVDLKSSVQANRERFYYVTREETQRVIDACPDAEWRVLVGLARYGGLRCPSEVLSLKWEHVHWGEDRLTVPSPKTAHHAGGESRIIPLFPELKILLRDANELAPDGAVYVVNRYRGGKANLRTQLERIIRRAGLKPWGKPWQNMRSSRETELAETQPMHVVCAWIGNSEPVAAKHYLQVTDEHYARAVEGAAKSAAVTPSNGLCGGEQETSTPRNSQGIRGVTGSYCTNDYPAWVGTIEENPEKTNNSLQGAAFGAAVHHDSGASDPELACVLAAWPYLDDAQRKRILAVVRQAAQG